MSIKIVTGNIGKISNISFRHRMFCRDVSFTDFQFFKIFSEWMNIILELFSAVLILLSNVCQSRWRTLDGRALHIMKNATFSTHFLATTSSSRTAVNQHWQR
ncbi:hypothetical protein D3C86_1938090 [compost metagenome]